jgi:hypothetical protein
VGFAGFCGRFDDQGRYLFLVLLKILQIPGVARLFEKQITVFFSRTFSNLELF